MAPLVRVVRVPIPYASAHVELKGQLPQGHGPHIDISQYFTVAPGPGPDRKMHTVSQHQP